MPVNEQTYIKFFRHFSARLAERYGLYITFEYYKLLCSIRLKDAVKKESAGNITCIQGFILVHGTKVKVLKDRSSHKLLLTALPIKNKKKCHS